MDEQEMVFSAPPKYLQKLGVGIGESSLQPLAANNEFLFFLFLFRFFLNPV